MGEAFFTNWMTQLRKGLLELAILNAVGGSPVYGYEIVRQLSDLHSIAISEGTIYPILSRLKTEGYVESFLEESPDGPARKYYRLTAQGREELKRMNRHWRRIQNAVAEVQRENR
jgi:PadR family transcriptional regulator PadR